MITSLDELRTIAVRQILRKAPLEYLLRQALCKPWVASEDVDEMAWTDFKKLFFNVPKIHARLNEYDRPLDPGDATTAFLAALSHEILHNLWLHRYRAKGKDHGAWRAACEYAINYELGHLIGTDWIDHLRVMYPDEPTMRALRHKGLSPTTDGFYELLVKDTDEQIKATGMMRGGCHFCDDHGDEEETDPNQLLKMLIQMPDSLEKADVIKFLYSEMAQPQKFPWEMLLLGGLEEAMSHEQTWSKPSRRNELLPGWQHEKLLHFVWVLDISPSIDDDMKRSFMSTLQAGINLYHDAIHRVIFFSGGIDRDFVVSSGTNMSQIEIPCGDGTDLNEVWGVLERDKPEYALVLTDLEMYEVPKPSVTKIIWGIVGNQRLFDPDYGIKVELK